MCLLLLQRMAAAQSSTFLLQYWNRNALLFIHTCNGLLLILSCNALLLIHTCNGLLLILTCDAVLSRSKILGVLKIGNVHLNGKAFSRYVRIAHVYMTHHT